MKAPQTKTGTSERERIAEALYEKAAELYPDCGAYGEDEFNYRHYTDGIDASLDAVFGNED